LTHFLGGIMSVLWPYYRRNLPHYQPLDAAFFVTFCLTDSLSMEIVLRLKQEQREIERELNRIKDKIARHGKLSQSRKRYFGRFDEFLDRASYGPQWLNDDCIAGIVADAMHYRDGKEYDLLAYTIMPNHAHTVFTVDSVA